MGDLAEEYSKPKPPIKVDFLRWRHTDETKFKESYEFCSHGDEIELKAEAQGIENTGHVTFEIEEPPGPQYNFANSIWTMSAQIDTDNTASAKWTVDLSKVNDPSKLRFTASARSKYAETKCPIKIKGDIYGFAEPVSGEITLQDAQEIALKISEDFEGGKYQALAGDFDGQGISWGIMQWNIGQGTLAPLWLKMKAKNEAELIKCFGEDEEKYKEFTKAISEDVAAQLLWARSIQNNTHVLNSAWKNIFIAIGNVVMFQEVQKDEAITLNHSLTMDKIKWLRTIFSEETAKIALRTYVELFDLSNQHKRLTEAVQTKLTNKWDANKPKTQFQIIKDMAIERALIGKKEFRADSISRRLGILNAKAQKVDSSLDAQITTVAERQNNFFNLLTTNKTISNL